MVNRKSFHMEEEYSDDIISIRKYILSSWERCLNNGMLPEDMPHLKKVSAEELDKLVKQNKIL